MASEANVFKIKQKKKVTKAGLTRIENFINSIDHDTVDIEKLKLRLNKLEDLWKALLEIQIELLVVDEDTTDELMEQELESYEDKYIRLKLIRERILKNRARPAVIDNPDQDVGVNSVRRRANDSHVRLPKIDLPTFSGAYEKWHPFFDIFNSLIHSNDSLNDIQRFHYLKSSLKGDAAETIASLEISNVNYADAWSRLKVR